MSEAGTVLQDGAFSLQDLTGLQVDSVRTDLHSGPPSWCWGAAWHREQPPPAGVGCTRTASQGGCLWDSRQGFMGKGTEPNSEQGAQSWVLCVFWVARPPPGWPVLGSLLPTPSHGLSLLQTQPTAHLLWSLVAYPCLSVCSSALGGQPEMPSLQRHFENCLWNCRLRYCI